MAGLILIADDVATNRIILKVKLAAACYDVIHAGHVDHLMETARAQRPDLIIVNQNLLGGGAVAATRKIRLDPTCRAIPVIVALPSPDPREMLDALSAGADDVLSAPLDETVLLALVRNLIRTRANHDDLAHRQTNPSAVGFAETVQAFTRLPRIALVAPSRETGLMWRASLGKALADRVTVLTTAQALKETQDGGAPDAFVIANTQASSSEGLRLISELRSRRSTRHALIFFNNQPSAPCDTITALDMGANAVLNGPFDAQELTARLNILIPLKFEADASRKALDQRLRQAMKDPLTGLSNRRCAQEYLNQITGGKAACDQTFTLMLLDLDRFKSVNDRFGHLAGDDVLVDVARRLRANLRADDLLARIGGEEFLVALPGIGPREAGCFAERLRRVISDQPVVTSAGESIPITMSIGVVVGGKNHNPEAPVERLIESADKALYASKAEGRNQVTFVRTAA